MDFTDWLDAEEGRATAVASHFNVSRSAVSQWRKNGVPVEKMKALREFTNAAVTLDEMVPDAPPAIPADQAQEVRDAA